MMRVLLLIVSLYGVVSAAPPADVLATDERLVRSPYNWVVNGDGGITSNTPGAYVRGVFNGTGIVLAIDTTANQPMKANQYPAVEFRLDDRPWQRHQLSAGETHITLADELDEGLHEIEIIFAGVWWQAQRWIGGERPAASLTISGLAVQNGMLSQATPRSRKVLVFGDSNSEGYEALKLGVSVANQDAGQATPMLLGHALDAEVGVVAFAGQGNTRGGGGGVPSLADAWAWHWQGQPRLIDGRFHHAPDLVINLHGQNDASLTVEQVRELVAAWREAAPDALIILAAPANLQHAQTLQDSAAMEDRTYSVSAGVDFLQSKRGAGAFHNANHLNVRGHARLAASLARQIGELLDAE